MKMEEWKECKLSDICDYGKDRIEVSSLDNSNYISTENMLPNRAGITTATTLPTGELTPSFEIDDTLVSNIRPYFKKIWKATFSGGCSADVLVFKAKENVSKEYLYYVSADDEFFKYSMTTSKGTKMPRGDKTSIMNYPVTLPPLPTQQKIAAILSSLDDKIELNNKINTNLEQQAQALFKNWFVDFEPSGGKMPEEWKEIPLEELCTVVTKGTTPTTLGKKFTDSGINFIKGESILDNHIFDLQKISHIDDETNLMLKRSIIQPNDILFTIAGTLGRFAIIDETLTPANTNQAVGIIRANPKIISPYYLYSFFIGNWHNDYYTKRIQQAVQANLSLGTIKSLPIIIPDSQNLNNYTNLIEPLFRQMKQLENENIKLADLRDTILPKLINGEIEV